ncbi:MAG: hypothetical protein P1V81_01280 [Planctomycetota bacterium]|nr:hypothetical protein [Planctomycetota bacterium]
MPALEQAPFHFLEPGHVGFVYKQPLANQHELKGDFDVGPVPDPLGGPPNFFFVHDEGEVLGKYELGFGVRGAVAQDTTLEVGLGYRLYEIDGLQPAPDPAILFRVETVDSLQFYIAMRRYFESPIDLGPRWRLFAELGLYLVPGVTVDSQLEFLTTVKPISSNGEAYRFLGLTGGAAYQLTDALVLEGGLTWEEPLEDLVVDLSTSVDFGGGQVIDVPIDAQLTPRGAVGFVSLTWYP